MPGLKNPKHEVFCQMVADGMTQTDAYIMAGYADTKSTRFLASRLATNEHIKTRIAEIRWHLQEQRRRLADDMQVDRKRVLSNALVAWQMAYEKGDISGMNQHNRTMAELAGLTSDKDSDLIPRVFITIGRDDGNRAS